MNNAHRAQYSPPGQINFPVRKGLTMTLDGLVVGNAVAPINCFCKGGRASGFSRRLCLHLYTPIYYHENWRDSETRPQTKGDLIGKIPWLREREITSVPITESVFGRWNLNDYFVESSLNKFTVITTFADAFPSYLPGRYHNMDCDAIRRYSKDGAYWVNALHFSNICINHGTQPYYNLSHRKSVGLERATMNAKTLQDEGGPELCGTAAEFLFEPWVLLQLPFQPALLHQWAVAALAEAHRFYRRVVEITSRGFAPAFVDFYEKLITINSTVQNHCHTFIARFFMIYCKAPIESIHVKARKMLDSNFSEQLAETLAALEFILSDSCTDILNFMKRTSWCKKHPLRSLNFNCPFAAIPPGTRPAAIKYLEINSSDREATGRARNAGETSKKRSTGLMDDSTLDPAQLKIHVKDFKAFACQNILKEEGPLKGVDDPAKLMDKIMNSLSPKEHSFFAYTILGYYDENIALGTDSPACTEGGVIQQILSLGRDFIAEGSLGAMTRMIWRTAAVVDKNVYLDAGDLHVPEGLTIEDCILILEACPTRKEQWTRQQIFEKAQLTLGHADNFTTRIRALVLKMYEKQYATCEEGPFHFYPECHLVQYVLPCFVAMSLDAQEDTHLSTKLKEELELFLDALIKSYEQHEFVQLIGIGQRKDIFTVR